MLTLLGNWVLLAEKTGVAKVKNKIEAISFFIIPEIKKARSFMSRPDFLII